MNPLFSDFFIGLGLCLVGFLSGCLYQMRKDLQRRIDALEQKR